MLNYDNNDTVFANVIKTW